MLEKHLLSDPIIISCLNTHYGIEAATLTLLPIGADLNASVYQVQTPDQTSYFIKLKLGRNHDIGVEIVELLRRAGISQIIPSIKTIKICPPSKTGKGRIFIIARLRLNNARKFIKLSKFTSAVWAAICAILIGPPNA